MKKNSAIDSAAFFFILGLFAGCSGRPEAPPPYEIERSHQYKVSVYSDGKEVKDFNTALVQRISLSPKVVSALGHPRTGLPVEGVSEKDVRGKVLGIRVVASRRGGNPALLGLREKDVIVSVGSKPARQIEDLRLLAADLERDKSASVTIQRDGRPHKILYYLSNS